MVQTTKGCLLDLPAETAIEVCKHLDPLSKGHLASVCKPCSRTVAATPFESIQVTLHAGSVARFCKWHQVHGPCLTSLHIAAPSLHGRAAKAALWAALSNPASTQQLRCLQLDMPLTPEDEAAVLSRVCSAAPRLASLHMHYQRPLSHAKMCNITCFCAHSSPTVWAAAQKLQELRLAGACLCNMASIAQLTRLTRLEVGCCNTTAPDAEFSTLLRALPSLQHLKYTSSKQAAFTPDVCAALAAQTSLTHLELHNFAVAGPAAAGAAAAAGPAALNAQLAALQQVQVLKLVDCSGVEEALPCIASAAPQLTALAIVRSRQDGFMPAALLADLFSGSDSDSDSDSGDSNGDGSSSSEDGSSSDGESEDDVMVLGGSCCSGSPGSSTGCCSGTLGCQPAAAAAGALLVAPRPGSFTSSSSSRSSRPAVFSSRRPQQQRLFKALGVAHLALLQSLSELDLSGFGLTSIKPLCSLGQLRVLRLGPAQGPEGSSRHVNRLDSKGLAGIGALQLLQHLDLSHNKLCWDSVALLTGLTRLTYLSLAANDLSGYCSTSGSELSCCGELFPKTGDGVEAVPEGSCCKAHSSGSANSSGSTYDGSARKSCCGPNSSSGGGRGADASAAARCSSASGCSTDSLRVCVGAAAGCQEAGSDDETHQQQQQLRYLLTAGSSSSRDSRLAAAAAAAQRAVLAAGVLPPRLYHLDISGCGLSCIPGLNQLSGLTSLRAGTALRHAGAGVWARTGNQLSPRAVAGVSSLLQLQELVLAARVPAACYGGLRGMSQLTRLVLQDFSAVEGLFLLPEQQGPAHAALAAAHAVGSHSCGGGSSSSVGWFPHLRELGLMLPKSPGVQPAMQRAVLSCRGLKRVSIFQDLSSDGSGNNSEAVTDSACLPAAAVAAAAAHAAAASASAANVTGCCPGGSCGPVSAAAEGCTSGMCCNDGAEDAGIVGAAAAAAAAALPRPAVQAAGAPPCCSQPAAAAVAVAVPMCASAAAASWHSCLTALTALTRLDMPASTDLRLLSGLPSQNIRHLQLLGPEAGLMCPDKGPDKRAAQPDTAVPGPPAGGVAGRGGAGGLVEGLARLYRVQSVTRCVPDEQLLGLRALTSLTHLELQQVCVSSSAVDDLQMLLPCTRISV